MKVLGIGIDVVELERFRGVLAKQGEAFMARVFTQEERAYAEKMKDPAIHLAARFAAKEAVAKAFGTGFGESMSWNEVEVWRDAKGKPGVSFSGKTEAFVASMGTEVEVMVSLTHTESYAAANAVVMCG